MNTDNTITFSEPTKEESTGAKGIAILGMVMLHLFCRLSSLPYTPLLYIKEIPFIYYLGLFGDICVPIYCFVSGYAQYLIWEKQKESFRKNSIKRLLKLYINYLVILFLFSVIGLLLRNEVIPGSVIEFLGNVFLFGMSYNGAWWFILTYIFLVLLSPLLIKVTEKLPVVLTIIISGGIYFVSYLFRFVILLEIPNSILSWLWEQLLLIGTSQFSFLFGMVFYRFKWISRIKSFLKTKAHCILFGITVSILMFVLHCFEQSMILAPVTGISVLICFYVFPHAKTMWKVWGAWEIIPLIFGFVTCFSIWRLFRGWFSN